MSNANLFWTVEEIIEKWNCISVINALVITGIAKTKSEARRMIEQGSIKVNDIKVISHNSFIMIDPVTNYHCLLQDY